LVFLIPAPLGELVVANEWHSLERAGSGERAEGPFLHPYFQSCQHPGYSRDHFGFPFPVRFIAKKSLAWFPIFGWNLYLSKHILIDRESTPSALKSLKKAASLLKSGISIIVFPEGTRSADGQVKEFKRGSFLLGLQSQAPIVPVAISGTYRMLPRASWYFWPGTIEIHVEKPIPTQGLPLRESRTLMQRVRNTIIQNLKPEGQKT
jgi:1-acyl-sn-glycerol-3-phosphate acyltransferase